MNNYRKGSNIEEELTKDNIPIENLPENFLWMHVKGGTKVSNVVDYARKALDSGEHRHVVWSSSGGGLVKTISSVEILKRSYKTLHQVTRLAYQNVEENWEPLVEGLDEIVVKRQIPAIHILTSLDPIDPNTLGYQCSTDAKTFAHRIDETNGDDDIEEPFDLHAKRNPRPKNKPRFNNDRGDGKHENNKKPQPKKKRKPEGGEQSAQSSGQSQKKFHQRNTVKPSTSQGSPPRSPRPPTQSKSQPQL